MSGTNKIPNPDIIGYEGPVGHEKSIHKTHFGAVKVFGGSERVRVRTSDGFTFMAREVAEEEGFEILPQKREKRRKGAEVKNGKHRSKSSLQRME